jgi:hypothetical protein
MNDMTTIFEIRNPTGRPVDNLTLGLEASANAHLDKYYANALNKNKKVEVILMSSDDANRVRQYWQNIHEGGHHA